jgi:mannose-6-phosphate isomerase
VEEFAVARITLGRKGGQAIFDTVCGPSIFICIEGSGALSVNENVEEVGFGFIFFVGHGVKAVLESRSCEPFVCYRAFCDAVGS